VTKVKPTTTTPDGKTEDSRQHITVAIFYFYLYA